MATQSELIAALPDRLQELPNTKSQSGLTTFEIIRLYSAVQELQRNQLLIIQALKATP